MDLMRIQFDFEPLAGVEKVFVSNNWAKLNLKGHQYVALTFPIGTLSTIVFKHEIDSQLDDDEVRLSSYDILQKHGLDMTVETVKIKGVRLPTLSQISIIVPPSVYTIVSNNSIVSNSQYIVDLINQERGFLVRKGDFIRCINGELVHCEEWNQGLIDLQTNVVLIKGPQSSDIITQRQDYIADGETTGLLGIGIINFNDLSKCSTAGSYINQFPYEDPEMFVCLHYKDLLSFGCFSGDIIELKTQAEDSFPLFVRVFPFLDPSDYHSGKIYMSPLLKLQFIGDDYVSIVRHMNKKVSISSTSPLPIPLALDIHVSRVASKVTLDKRLQAGFLNRLKTYFELKKRVITLGQIIPIPFDENIVIGARDDEMVLPVGEPNCIAYFQITSGKVKGDGEDKDEVVDLVEGKQYFVSYTRSRVVQKGVVSDQAITSLIDSTNVKWDEIVKHVGLQAPFPFKYDGKSSYLEANKLRKILKTGFMGKQAVKTTIAISSSTRSVGKTTLVRSLGFEFGATLLEFDSHELENMFPGQPAAMIGYIRGKSDKILDCCERVIIYLRHFDSLCKIGDGGSSDQRTIDESVSQKFADVIDHFIHKGVIVICSCVEIDNLNEMIRSKIVFELEIQVPNDQERQLIYKHLLHPNSGNYLKYKFKTRDDVSINSLSMQSAALTPSDIASIVKNVEINALERLRANSKSLNIPTSDLVAINGGFVLLIPEDFEESINSARNKFSDSIGAPRIPNVKWEDVGGLDIVKDEIMDTIDMPLKHPELFGSGMKKRSGILFYGPPGTGKTLLAKAIATNFSLNFFSVKGPELLNMYIGESEANVRRVFQKARDAKPCVVFFDELDSVAPKRGNQGDAGGVMDRIVSQLLAELDGMSDGDGGNGVFVVGASNRPDLLDEALLRPGRFDKMLYLGISDTHDKQAKILEALSRKFPLGKDVDLLGIAKSCPFNFTGADFYALCSDAMLGAMGRTASEVEEKVSQCFPKISTRAWFDLAPKENYAVEVSQQDFLSARENLIASVSAGELSHYEAIRDSFTSK